jgi:FixJ family two-component response regulator
VLPLQFTNTGKDDVAMLVECLHAGIVDGLTKCPAPTVAADGSEDKAGHCDDTTGIKVSAASDAT